MGCGLRPAGGGTAKNPGNLLAADSPGQFGLYRRHGECSLRGPVDKNGKAPPLSGIGKEKTYGIQEKTLYPALC